MITVKTKELDKLIESIGLPKNEVAQALKVTRSTLWRWLNTGELPEKVYVFLKLVQYKSGHLGLREVQFNEINFKDENLNSLALEIKQEFSLAINKQLPDDSNIDLSSIDSSDLIEEIKRRNPSDQVIIARVKSLN